MAKPKKCCGSALVNIHLPNCPHKNIVSGETVGIDFDVFGEMLKEMEKRVLEEDASLEGRKTSIFVAPVVKKKRNKKKGAA